MILQSLDLDALQGAVLWSTNRRLSDFLLETLNGSLPRFHTRGEDVPPFVAKAGGARQQKRLHLRQGVQLARAQPFIVRLGVVGRSRVRIGVVNQTSTWPHPE